MELEVLNIKGEKTGRSVQLADEIFGVEPNDHVLYLDVKRYLINQRQGTHKSKERNEVHGSTRKLRKQKGGGGARIGSIKSPVLRGGGRIFGPRPRTYDLKLNKKVKTIARKSALSYKAKENKIVVLENFDMEQPKTREYINILNALNLGNEKTLMVLQNKQDNIVRSARNLPNVEITTSNDLSTYQVVHAGTLVLIEDAVNSLNESLK
jgi:large subunit ribosomal protein L4